MDPVLDANGAAIRVGARVRSLRTNDLCTVTRFTSPLLGLYHADVWGFWDAHPDGREYWVASSDCVLVEAPPVDPNDMSMFDLNEPKEPDAELDEV